MVKIVLLPFRAARTFVKLSGVRGALLFAVGVAVGLLIAPTSGARLRAKLKARLAPPAPERPPAWRSWPEPPACGGPVGVRRGLRTGPAVLRLGRE